MHTPLQSTETYPLLTVYKAAGIFLDQGEKKIEYNKIDQGKKQFKFLVRLKPDRCSHQLQQQHKHNRIGANH